MKVDKASTTRDEILLLFKTRGALPVSVLAEKLGITEMAVRRHIQTLERDHYIGTELVRQAMGRPTTLYFLTEKGHNLFPRNYSDLAIDFLKDIEDLEGIEKVDLLFERREERLTRSYTKRMMGLSFEERIEELAKIQNSKGYMAKWEKDEEGNFIIIEDNCPISEIAKEYNKACACELSLFQKLLGTNKVERTQCLAKGGERCVYSIKKE
jgi:predicted ArsR family transcriptional regulator